MNAPVNFHTTAEAKAVADEVRKSIEPRVIEIADPEGKKREVLLVPGWQGGLEVKSTKALTDEYRAHPERREGTATLTEVDSFIAHVNRFKDEHSAIFVDRTPTAPKMLAVLDYHCQGASGSPRFGQHRSLYSFPISEEWRLWTGKNSQPFGQLEFAQWVEDHLLDVADPSLPGETAKKFAEALGGVRFASAATLLALSRGLALHVKHEVEARGNLASGESTIVFKESHSDGHGSPVKIPGAFLLAIPIFQGSAPYEIPTRLRYRVNSGHVVWSFEMHRAQAAFDDEVDEAVERVTKECAVDVFAGTPE